MNIIQSQYLRWRETIAPVLRESKFKEHGRITPEEFVVTGDFLTYKFPVWTWEKGDAKPREHLPVDKQYLITRGVPCLRRATSLAYTDADEDSEKLLIFGGDGGDKGDEWVQTHAGRQATEVNPQTIDDIPDDEALSKEVNALNLGGRPSTEAGIPDMDDIPDMEEDDLEGSSAAVVAKPAAPPVATKGNILQVRTYDVMISYDKLYQTPRMWLLGYDENGTPLKPEQVFQDISTDHANKTVTIEPFPHSNTLTAASVHPCKHASVMKKVIERMNAGMVEEQRKASGASSPKEGSSSGSGKRWLGGAIRRVTGGGSSSAEKSPVAESEDDMGMKVDFYLVVFLKFVASIVPTIEVDSTASF